MPTDADDVASAEPSLHGNSDYSPDVTKMLKGWKDRIKPPGHNEVLEMEAVPEVDDGREEITWDGLHTQYGYEKPGKGLKLTGDISQRDKNNWQYQKHVKLRDREGTEHAVFFYVDEPNTWDYDDMEIGSILTINSPRLHRFMDGQDGMRLDEEKMVARLIKRPLTDKKRINYANLMRENGNRKYKEEKFEDAIEFYETAINHVSGSSFHDSAQLKPETREIELKCHNNIAQAACQLKNYTGAIDHCRKALAINSKSAKAHFRLGIAHAARGNDKEAVVHYNKALALAQDDPSVSAAAIKKELSKSSGETRSQKSALKNMYSGFLGGKKQFGAKKGMAALSGGVLSRLPSIFNFRDLTAGKHISGRRLHKTFLYRSSAVCNTATPDLTTLCNEYGIKTVIDMRSSWEKSESAKEVNPKFFEEFGRIGVRENPDKLGTCLETAVAPAKGDTPDIATIRAGRVCLEVDILDSLFDSMLTTSERLVNAGLCAMCQGDRAVVHRSLCTQGRMEVGHLLRTVLDERPAEIIHIIRTIADPACHPVILSCAQGKDLTGLISILVLGCLGVDEDSLIDDFMQSLVDIPDSVRKSLSSQLARAGLPLSYAHTSYETAQELLEFLDGRYGGPAGYLQYHGFSDDEQAALKKVFARD